MTNQIERFVQSDKLIPLNELDKNDLDYLYSESEVLSLEPRTLITYDKKVIVYLLEGEVSLLSGGFVTETFTHLNQRALSPLFNEMLDEDSAVLTSHGQVLHIHRTLFEGLYSQVKAYADDVSMQGLSEFENRLFQILLNAFMHKKLQIPVLPEAALKIRQVINTPGVGSAEIIQIVQTDPVLSARLMKVANSPLYGTWREIKTLRDAVRRLGLETTKNLTFGLSVKQLFNAKSSLIKNHIKEIYQESTAIAAIAHVITQMRAPELDPEQALLCGLLQSLGLIPILKYIDEHPSIIQTIEQLGKTIENLYLPVSKLILKEWHFDDEFIEMVENSRNWQRNTEKTVDYVDIIIAARLIYLEQQGFAPVDNIDELAVIKKLHLHEYDDDGNFFMDKAEDKIEQMQKLIETV